MRLTVLRLTIAAFGAAALCTGTSLAQQKPAPEEIEAILGQSLLEQAAFRTCATAENDTETAGFITKGWPLDLEETASALLQAGYPDSYIRALKARLDIDKATPKFADRAALTAYCATLGDWQRRRALFFFSSPQVRIKQVLKR
jgi:hypothetical protein